MLERNAELTETLQRQPEEMLQMKQHVTSLSEGEDSGGKGGGGMCGTRASLVCILWLMLHALLTPALCPCHISSASIRSRHGTVETSEE